MNYLEIAGRKGYQFAIEHSCADGATALIWARRFFPTKSEVRAFIRSWRAQFHASTR